MSQQLINLSSDLKRLQDDGYDIEIRSNYLLVKNVPYVNSERAVNFGTLVSSLCLAGNVTAKPDTHVALFSGEHPCNKDGSKMVKIAHQSVTKVLDRDFEVHHSFSSKPANGYKDYYDKMTTYSAIISGPAQAIKPDVTARTFPVIESAGAEAVFHYVDTASSRADINVVSRKLESLKIGIVGLGGTGSYVLDLVAKTCVKEIRIFDGDKFLQHNAFRSPGAPSLDDLRKVPLKVDHFKDIYSKMHRNIVSHGCFIDDTRLDLLQGLNFVFVCVDSGVTKRIIFDKLEELGIPFVDVGMGVQMADESLFGILRVTSSTPQQRDHVRTKKRVSFAEDVGHNDYVRNIQIADLNALNASLAVIKWKKVFGYYQDLDKEHHCTYTIDGNMLLNEDRP